MNPENNETQTPESTNPQQIQQVTSASSPTPAPAPSTPVSSKMTSFQIAAKTAPFFLLRAGVSAAIAIVFVMYAVICAAIVTMLTNLTNGGPIPGIVGFVFFFGAFGMWRFIKSYVLYMVKAGHVAVVSEFVAKGSIENNQNQIAYGTAMVKKYFLTANAMWILDNLMRRAVYEIQKGINTIGQFLSFIPGISFITSIADMFVGLLLNYSDESVFAYVFQKGDTNVWKSSADGIVLFAQNWKAMIKAAGVLTLSLVGLLAATGIIGLGVFTGATALNLNGIIIAGIVIAIFLLLKWALLDPFVMIFMVNRYLEVALGQQPSVDMYSKIQEVSKKFQEIINRSQGGISQNTQVPAIDQSQPQSQPSDSSIIEDKQ